MVLVSRAGTYPGTVSPLSGTNRTHTASVRLDIMGFLTQNLNVTKISYPSRKHRWFSLAMCDGRSNSCKRVKQQQEREQNGILRRRRGARVLSTLELSLKEAVRRYRKFVRISNSIHSFATFLV